jgi:hypothetical protein
MASLRFSDSARSDAAKIRTLSGVGKLGWPVEALT